MKTFQVPAELAGISYLNTPGCVALRFRTSELSTKDKVLLSEYHQKTGYLLFKEDDFQENDVPKDNTDMKSKSPAQRLRGVLWILHQQRGGKNEDFESFYTQQMEKAINRVKDVLDK